MEMWIIIDLPLSLGGAAKLGAGTFWHKPQNEANGGRDETIWRRKYNSGRVEVFFSFLLMATRVPALLPKLTALKCVFKEKKREMLCNGRASKVSFLK